MARGWLVSVVLLSGCFDFDLLERPFDDLSASSDLAQPVVDLAGADFAGVDFALPPAADLAGADFAGDDLAAVDLGGTDLIPCVPPPSFSGRVFYVAPGGTGDGTAAAMASGSINDMVQKAIITPDLAAILIAAGTYTETVAITAGNVSLYGGFNAGYTCRDPSPQATRLVGPPNANGMVINGAGFLVDGMFIAGGGGSSSNSATGIAIDGAATATSGTIRNCEVRSQNALDIQVLSAYALSIQAATVTIDHSHILAGTTTGSISPASWALYTCTAAVTVSDSLLETYDPVAGHGQVAAELDEPDCGTPSLTPALIVIRSTLWAHGASNIAFRLRRTGTTAQFQSSALVAEGGDAVVATNTAGLALGLATAGSTFFAAGTPSRAINVGTTSMFTLTTNDSIFTANIPIGLSGMENTLKVVHGGVNLLHGTTTTIVASGSGATTISGYQSTFDPNAQDLDPMLAPDHIHLAAGSPAVGLTGNPLCTTTKDIDDQARPRGTNCDVGADEQ